MFDIEHNSPIYRKVFFKFSPQLSDPPNPLLDLTWPHWADLGEPSFDDRVHVSARSSLLLALILRPLQGQTSSGTSHKISELHLSQRTAQRQHQFSNVCSSLHFPPSYSNTVVEDLCRVVDEDRQGLNCNVAVCASGFCGGW